MRWFILSISTFCLLSTLEAHFPERQSRPVHPRIDVIGPLGTRLPISHRRAYNRPSKIGGKVAYYIAPTSQEAMAWHNATHRKLYKNDRPRIVVQYFYPKPWESLRIGARPDSSDERDQYGDSDRYDEQSELVEVTPDEPIVGDRELIEQ